MCELLIAIVGIDAIGGELRERFLLRIASIMEHLQRFGNGQSVRSVIIAALYRQYGRSRVPQACTVALEAQANGPNGKGSNFRGDSYPLCWYSGALADSESCELDLSRKFPKVVLAAGLLLVLAIYSLGWSGTLHFDDEPNLSGLHGVSDFASGLQFTFSGEAGPTGRPLSLATFALQHESWPDPEPFLIFNTMLHVINGLLCFLLLRRLLGWMLPDARSAEWLAVMIALIWAASPFLASSNLVVVQRMTGLSAFFALLALNVYTIARTSYRSDSWRSNLWLASIAGTGTLLAGLAKENGFLLPVFLLLIEWLLVANARITIKPLNRGFFWVVLVAPMAVILGLLLYRGLSSAGYLYRDFTLSERLLTQPRVLFDYIVNLLIPSTESITPFHDAYVHSTGLFTPATTLPSVVGLVVLITFAWVIRRRWPIVAFGGLFFLAGHLAESTVVPLELYFPHRNYLPAIGLYLALGVLAMNLLGRRDFGFPMRASAAVAYFVISAGVLASGTSLWGNRQLSAEMWYIQQRDSERSALYLYRYYIENGENGVAASLLDHLVDSHPDNSIFKMQALSFCDEQASEFEKKIRRAEDSLINERIINLSIGVAVQKFASLAATSDCEHFGIEQARLLVAAALGNKHNRIRPQARQALLLAKAQLHADVQDYDSAIRILAEAMRIDPLLDIALMTTYFYMEKGAEDEARAYLTSLLDDLPIGFPLQLAWEDRLEKLLDAIESAKPLPVESLKKEPPRLRGFEG